MTRIVRGLAMGVLLGGCGTHGDSAAPEAQAVVDVRTATITTLEFRDEIMAPGQWRASGEVDVIAPGAALIQSVEPHVGDEVAAGRIVAWLETRESAAAVQGARLMVEQAHDESSRVEARRALELAQHDLVRLPVVARRGGIVIRRSVEPGSQVADGGEIVAIVPRDLIVFEGRIPASERGRVRAGQSAIIVSPGAAAIPATVRRILPVADSLGQTALIWLTPSPGRQVPDLQSAGTATIVVGSTRHSQAVPDSAVVEDDLTGENRVAIVGPAQRAIWTPVVLGASARGWREIRSPLLPVAARVVVEGQRGLPDSTRVKLLP